MISRTHLPQLYWQHLVLVMALVLSISCGNDENPLAPYEGQPAMSKIVVEAGSLTPKLTWLGGYVTVLGINRGAVAALDSTLVWLIYAGGDNIRYSVTFGEVPPDAQNISSQYGGQSLDRLVEDDTYTYWVLKEDVWSQVSANVNKPFRVDESLTAATIKVQNDTIFINAHSHTQEIKPIDLFVNVKNINPTGRLAIINVQQSSTSNHPIITWKIRQAGVTDTLIAAMGVVNAGQYQAAGNLWEVWSVDSIGAQPVYGKKNVIREPVVTGQPFPETRVFVEYPAEGLSRNKTYYVWVANKDWDGQRRNNATNYYAHATFQTW